MDVHLHDTYFVVAHFHYVMMGGTVIAFLGGLHYWWPKMFGRMYNEKLGATGCALVFIGFNVTFFTQFILGSRGMPRRYYNYLDQFQRLHASRPSGRGFSARACSSRRAICWRPSASRWTLRKIRGAARTLEWEANSPPITENFDFDPVVYAWTIRFPPREA